MLKSFIQKIEPHFALSEADRCTFELVNAQGRSIGPRADIIAEATPLDHIHLIRSGIACRYRLLPDGTRAILGFLIPGDICDLNAAVIGSLDHSVGTLSMCDVVRIPHDILRRLTEHYPALDRVLRWAVLVDEAILREWLLVMGRRSADRQVAHLFCEFLTRFRAIGLAPNDRFQLPLNQTDLSDAMGMSTVHMNRTLQSLRRKGLIDFRCKSVFIPNFEALKDFAGFNPAYLSLTSEASTPLAG